MSRTDPFAPLPPPEAYPPFTALRAFDAVARLGGVRKAADALAIHHSAISRHLRTVEDWTGASLVARSGRGVTLTEDGWRYHDRLAVALDALADATLGFIRSRPHHNLVVWSRPGIALEWLVPRLDELRAAFPEMRLEIRPTHVAPEFSAHEVDLFIQYTSNWEPDVADTNDVRAHEFIRSPIFPVASPKYLAAYPPIRTAEDLLRHHLMDDELVNEEDEDTWTPWFSHLGIACGKNKVGAKFRGPQLSLDAARRGLGILLSTEFLARADLDAGRLVEVVGSSGRFDSCMTGSYWLLGRSDHWDQSPTVEFRNWICNMTASGYENLVRQLPD